MKCKRYVTNHDINTIMDNIIPKGRKLTKYYFDRIIDYYEGHQDDKTVAMINKYLVENICHIKKWWINNIIGIDYENMIDIAILLVNIRILAPLVYQYEPLREVMFNCDELITCENVHESGNINCVSLLEKVVIGVDFNKRHIYQILELMGMSDIDCKYGEANNNDELCGLYIKCELHKVYDVIEKIKRKKLTHIYVKEMAGPDEDDYGSTIEFENILFDMIFEGERKNRKIMSLISKTNNKDDIFGEMCDMLEDSIDYAELGNEICDKRKIKKLKCELAYIKKWMKK